jgi:hypothetical protein
MSTVFISHSSKDKQVADHLATLFTAGMGIHPNDIFCTSLDGQGIRPGKVDTEEIRGALLDCQVAVLLISNPFRDSCYCNYELGALWLADKPLYVLLTPQWTVQRVKTENRLNWLLANRQMTSINNEKDWDNTRDSLTADLGLRGVPTATWQTKKTDFIKWTRHYYLVPTIAPMPTGVLAEPPSIPLATTRPPALPPDAFATPEIPHRRRPLIPPPRSAIQ